MISTLIADVRYALRQLRKSPGFTITAVLTLALGIGANSAILTVVDAVLLKNLPVADPKSLVRLGDTDDCCVNGGIIGDGDNSIFTLDTYESLKKSSPEFEELAAMQAGYSYRPLTVRGSGLHSVARSSPGEFVSGNYFRVFGLQPNRGRLLTPADDVEGAPPTALISYDAWQRDYAGDPSVIGSAFWINSYPVTVVGVATPGFYGDRLTATPPDFFVPITQMPLLANAQFVHEPSARWLYLIGRVKPGISNAVLQEKLSGRLRNALPNDPSYTSEFGKKELHKAHIVLTGGGAGIQSLQQEYGSGLHLLIGISGMVLLIACANIANLLLVRGMGRRAEISIRTALGAARARMMVQLLTESFVLASIGSVVGLIVAYFGTRMLLALAFPGAENVPIHATPSIEVLGIACGLSLLTGILFGAAPAWITSHAEPADALRGSTRTTAAGSSFLQRGLVVLQAALSLMLLVGAGLLSESLSKLEHQDFRLTTENRYIVHINPQAAGFKTTQVEALYRTMVERFHAIAGVKYVGISTYTPLEGNNWSRSWQIQGQPMPADDADSSASYVKATPEYFDAIGTHLIKGRGITERDTSTAPGIALVNQTFVRKFLKDKDPIGQHFGSRIAKAAGDWEIVGVVEDTNYNNPRRPARAMCFMPMVQRDASSKDKPIEKDEALYAGTIVLATERPIDGLESITRRTLASINPNFTVVRFQTFGDQIQGRFTQEKLVARLTLLFGILALLLAAIGLYGVTAYSVSRRTQEIGVRMALGANRASVVRMVLQSAMLQAGLGLVIGLPLTFVCVRFIKSQMYQVQSYDPAVLTTAIFTLALAAFLAGWLPARRAASIDPMRALRTE
jgi:macrolide transport system ATP-binding/permease protein